LRQRFAAGDADVGRSVAFDLLDDFRNGDLSTAVERVFSIAKPAAQRATR
jgi:hypothetical protein